MVLVVRAGVQYPTIIQKLDIPRLQVHLQPDLRPLCNFVKVIQRRQLLLTQVLAVPSGPAENRFRQVKTDRAIGLINQYRQTMISLKPPGLAAGAAVMKTFIKQGQVLGVFLKQNIAY